MKKKLPPLGKNLGALLGKDSMLDQLLVQDDEDMQLKQLDVKSLSPSPFQPRRDMEPGALQDLSHSIESQGIIQPLVARQLSNDSYELIAGERRWRAAQLAGLTTVPVLIRSMDDQQVLAVALIENLQREDLNPIEQALALQRLLDECNFSHQELATAVGKSRASVSNLLRLLMLRDEVKTMLEHGDLDMGHARALLSLDKKAQLEVAKIIVAKALTVRQTEALVKKALTPPNAEASSTHWIDPSLMQNLQTQLRSVLGTKVKLQASPTGEGKLVIHFNDKDKLKEIIAKLEQETA